MIHELKTWPDYFVHVLDGSKTFEYRRDDRGLKVGDVLHLREWEPTFEKYTGREVYRRVTYMLSVSRDFVVMALKLEDKPIAREPRRYYSCGCRIVGAVGDPGCSDCTEPGLR
jgi:hypothetical protein